MRDQENPNKIESCVKLSQIVKNCNCIGRGVEFDAIPGAPVTEVSINTVEVICWQFIPFPLRSVIK